MSMINDGVFWLRVLRDKSALAAKSRVSKREAHSKRPPHNHPDEMLNCQASICPLVFFSHSNVSCIGSQHGDPYMF